MILEAKSKKVPEGFERVIKRYSDFTWDSGKYEKDFKKHKIDFTVASCIFEGMRIECPDYGEGHFDERDEGARVYTVGKTRGKAGILYCTVIFIELSDSKIKIISARHSTKDERRWYNEYC